MNLGGNYFRVFLLKKKTVFVCSHYLIRMYVLVSENDSDLLHFFRTKNTSWGLGLCFLASSF